jgi:hypothetical protein
VIMNEYEIKNFRNNHPCIESGCHTPRTCIDKGCAYELNLLSPERIPNREEFIRKYTEIDQTRLEEKHKQADWLLTIGE